MRTDAEETAATLKCAHVAVFGLSIDAPDHSRVVRVIPWMNRRRRAERHEIISIRVRLCACVKHIDIQIDNKIVFLLVPSAATKTSFVP